MCMNCNYAFLWYYNVCVDFHKDIQYTVQELWGYPHVEWIVRPKPRTTLGLRGLVWVERFFAWNLSFFSIFQSTCSGAIISVWFSWGIYQTVRLKSMTRFGFTQITSRIDEAIGCNWSLETPKGENIETYSTFWRIQVCKQIAKLLCLQTGRVATWKGDAVMLVFSL